MEATNDESEIQNFYDKKTVLITGGTGFVGKLVVEKLLRSCRTVKKLYLLARPKKGKASDARLQELFDDVVFAEMKRANPDFLMLVDVIEGDIMKLELGLTLNDKNKIFKEVDIIIHSAATVSFGKSLREALLSNTRATRDMLDIAKQCEHLCAFVYVSTAYSNCNRKHISEQIYEPTVPASKIIDVAEIFDADTLEKMKEGLQDDFCNTYVMSKFYAEGIIREYEGCFPITIVRPSIVTATQKEPVKGWVGNINGPQVFTVAAAFGVLHTVKLKKENVMDLVPADKVSNCIVASAWHASRVHSACILVLNCVSRPQNPVTLYKFLVDYDRVARENPPEKAVGYYSVTFTKSRIVSTVIWFVTQWLYGNIVDAILVVLGKKPRLVKTVKKIDEAFQAVDFFIYNEFIFDNNNYQDMANALNDHDRKNFNFDMADINWDEYFTDGAFGLKRYLFKDSNTGQPRALRKQKWLFSLYYGYITLFVMIVAYLCISLIRMV